MATYTTVDGVDERQNRERNTEKNERHAIGGRVLERLHVIVDIDGDCACDARQIAADHEHDAEFAQRVSEAEHQRSDDAGNRERENHAPKCFEAAGSENRGSVEEFAVDGFEGCDEGLHGERQTVEDGSEDEPFKRKGHAVAKKRLPQFSQRAARAHGDEHVKAKNGGRKNEWKGYYSFEQKLASPIGIGEPIGERKSTGKKNYGNTEREPKGE